MASYLIYDVLGGLSKGAIYHHFKSKEEILETVTNRMTEESNKILAKIRDRKDLTGKEKLKMIFTESLNRSVQEEIFAAAPNISKSPTLLFSMFRDTVDGVSPNYILPIIREGVADGTIRTDCPEELALDTSQKFQVVVEGAELTAVSAVSMDAVMPVEGLPEDLQKIDRASLKTLQDCMQHVFEDGPKRDRRLWIGDLRLQAKANYATFGNYDLVKRCMYLFAGLTRDDGKIGACLFTEPVMQVDDTFLWDYSLFFVSILYDYYQETKDLDLVKELWPAACRQIELALVLSTFSRYRNKLHFQRHPKSGS